MADWLYATDREWSPIDVEKVEKAVALATEMSAGAVTLTTRGDPDPAGAMADDETGPLLAMVAVIFLPGWILGMVYMDSEGEPVYGFRADPILGMPPLPWSAATVGAPALPDHDVNFVLDAEGGVVARCDDLGMARLLVQMAGDNPEDPTHEEPEPDTIPAVVSWRDDYKPGIVGPFPSAQLAQEWIAMLDDDDKPWAIIDLLETPT